MTENLLTGTVITKSSNLSKELAFEISVSVALNMIKGEIAMTKNYNICTIYFQHYHPSII